MYLFFYHVFKGFSAFCCIFLILHIPVTLIILYVPHGMVQRVLLEGSWITHDLQFTFLVLRLSSKCVVSSHTKVL